MVEPDLPGFLDLGYTWDAVGFEEDKVVAHLSTITPTPFPPTSSYNHHLGP